jgi:hypothetical protein
MECFSDSSDCYSCDGLMGYHWNGSAETYYLRAPLIGRLRVAEPRIWCSLLALVSAVLVSAAEAAGARSPLEDAVAVWQHGRLARFGRQGRVAWHRG